MMRVAALLAVVVVAVAVIARSSGADPHELRVVFASATDVVSGQEVRLAGRKIGSILGTSYRNGQAEVRVRIDDTRAWPLRRGTTARLRFGSTVASLSRYVDLLPGPATAPAIPDNGAIAGTDTVTPVEFDEVFRIFDGPARRDARGMVRNLSATVDGQAPVIRDALRETPDGFDAVDGVMRDLGADPATLRTLVDSAGQVATAVEARDAQLRDLLNTSAATFRVLGTHADALDRALQRFPSTLRAARATLHRADHSVDALTGLVTLLRPGARRLVDTVPSAARGVHTLHRVAPSLRSTLRTGTWAAPDINRLLAEAVTTVPRLTSILRKAAPQLACVRPYAPEIVGFPTLWGAFGKDYDAHDHYARTLLMLQPFPNGLRATSKQITSLYKLDYAFPRPPGLSAGTPKLLPDCGAGADALDAAHDPEARP